MGAQIIERTATPLTARDARDFLAARKLSGRQFHAVVDGKATAVCKVRDTMHWYGHRKDLLASHFGEAMVAHQRLERAFNRACGKRLPTPYEAHQAAPSGVPTITLHFRGVTIAAQTDGRIVALIKGAESAPILLKPTDVVQSDRTKALFEALMLSWPS